MNIIDTLDQSDLFAGLPQAQLAAIAALTTEVTMRGGSTDFPAGHGDLHLAGSPRSGCGLVRVCAAESLYVLRRLPVRLPPARH